MLAANKASIEAQQDTDYEQVLLYDDKGMGLLWANQQFHRHRDDVRGEYVYMLDDDDRLTRDDAFTLFREATADRPELVLWRFDCGPDAGVLPSAEMRQKRRPLLTHVGTPCMLVRRDVWYEHIERFGASTAGDYAFLAATWPHLTSVVWRDEVIGKVQRKGNGRPE